MNVPLAIVAALLLAMPLFAQPSGPPPRYPATRPNRPDPDQFFDRASLKKFTDGAKYLDKHETGLYPGGVNDIPAAHLDAGKRVAAGIQPLDVDGKPDPAAGRIIAVVFGHSNTRDYFGAFSRELAARKDELNPRFELISAAVGGNQLPQLRGFHGAVWKLAEQQLARPGYSARQVQVMFLHTTWHGAGNGGLRPPTTFPDTMQTMQKTLGEVLAHAVEQYPNLRIAYLTSDGLRHFTYFEPHVWQEAFAFKWLIAAQIAGDAGTAFEDKPNAPRKLPWLQWGPYIWDNQWDRSYFTDGVHPAQKAKDIFVKKYWDFLRSDPVAQSWLWKPKS